MTPCHLCGDNATFSAFCCIRMASFEAWCDNALNLSPRLMSNCMDAILIGIQTSNMLRRKLLLAVFTTTGLAEELNFLLLSFLILLWSGLCVLCLHSRIYGMHALNVTCML